MRWLAWLLVLLAAWPASAEPAPTGECLTSPSGTVVYRVETSSYASTGNLRVEVFDGTACLFSPAFTVTVHAPEVAVLDDGTVLGISGRAVRRASSVVLSAHTAADPGGVTITAGRLRLRLRGRLDVRVEADGLWFEGESGRHHVSLRRLARILR